MIAYIVNTNKVGGIPIGEYRCLDIKLCAYMSEEIIQILSEYYALEKCEIYNQGQNSLDHLSLFSSIDPFTALKWIFCPLWDGIVIPNSLSQSFYPCFNVALCASILWINIVNGERGKALINMPEWPNTYGHDCSIFAILHRGGKRLKISW